VEVRDAGHIARAVPKRAAVWALDERGAEPTSVELARKLGAAMNAGLPGIALVIGGADGLPADLIQSAHYRLSLARPTLPHRLVRVVLLEQLYRALSILHDEPYHRE